MTRAAEKHQTRWQELCRDPSLNDLPYKTETNRRGQLILTPVSVSRSTRMSEVMRALDGCLSEGESYPSFAIATPRGTKVPDVVWASGGRLADMKETGDPTTLAPEICIEVMSEFSDWEEMREKRRLYLEAGAEEVWVVDGEGEVRFFGEEEMEASGLAEDFPNQL
jgi:Uma2 family endonuclease